MKRNVFVLALLGMLVLSSLAPALAQDEGLLIWADETRADVLLEIGNQFEEEFGVPVTVEQKGLGDSRDQLLEFGPAGEGPDILVSAHDSIGTFVANGAIIPIDLAGMEDSFTEGGLALFTFNDELWGVPYAIESTALIRNTDLVPDAPETWEAAAAVCGELRDGGLAEYGLLIQSGNTYHNSPAWSAFGGYIFGVDDEGSYNTADIGYDSEGMFAFGEWLASQVETGCAVPDIGDDEVFALFQAGDLAMFITGPWFSQRIIDSGIPYAISGFPMTEAGGMSSALGGGQGFVISAFSENQLLAETFLLDFMATQEAMQALFEADPRPPTFVGVDTSSDPNLEFFAEAAGTAQPMPAIPEMSAVWASSDAALTLIVQGDDPTESLTTADMQIAEAIDLARALAEGRTVVLVGSLQAAAGCDGDWNPGCLTTELVDQGDGIYSSTFTLPAGDYEYKVAINGSWDENYGVDGAAGGDNIMLSLSEETEVTFTFDDNTKIVSDSVNE